MLRLKFFYKFFKDKKNSSNQIVKFDSDNQFQLQNDITIKIQKIDQQISESSESLLQAQLVKLRSKLSKSNNFIEKIGTKVYTNKLDDSIYWYQKQLKELSFKRRELQINLEKIQGIFWINRIKRFLSILLMSFFLLFIIFIVISGFMVIIYLLPLIIVIFLGYWIITKKY